ncbi:MAG: MmcQ/YjbR family DNA-binding protein [Bacteroidales bacterium]|jgi:predicted DNA-binding protein (MmcQ/YjbR family)|nr:MmcQ/YjbR family DNA-binding protein [Bacteroidales bacterium]
MNIEELREYCLSVKDTTESLPFLGHNVLVFKIMDKMYAFAPLEPKDGRFKVDLKCDPERSVELRERYTGITPGHVPSALSWNSVYLESDVPDHLIRELIRNSVDEVIKNLPKKKREEYLKTGR